MAEVLTPPNEWLFAANPIVFELSGYAVSYVNVVISDGNDIVTFITAKYQLRNGAATIDISGYIRNLFKDFIGVDYTTDLTVSDTHARITIKVINGSNTYYDELHEVVYGVSQIFGNDINAYQSNAPYNFWMTGFSKLKYWVGYPMSVSFIRSLELDNSEQVVITEDIEGVDEIALSNYLTGLSQKEVVNFSLSVFDNDIKTFSKVFLTEYQLNGHREMSARTIEVTIVKDFIKEAIYLRWLNEVGGYDYYMFYKKDIKEIPKTAMVNLYPKDLQKSQDAYASHSGTQRPYVKQIGEQHVIGVNDITIAEFNELRKICRSPKIDLFVKDKTAWLGVNIQDTIYTIPQDEEIMDAEFTLLMPEIYSQLC